MLTKKQVHCVKCDKLQTANFDHQNRAVKFACKCGSIRYSLVPKAEVDRLCEENIKLVSFVLNRKVIPAFGMNFLNMVCGVEELELEGMLGLVRSAQRYNSKYVSAVTGKGVKFSTYAVRSIHQDILRVIKIKLVHCEGTTSWIDDDGVRRINPIYSLDTIMAGEDDGAMGFVDKDGDESERYANGNEVKMMLRTLPDRKRDIINKRFFLGYSLEETSRTLGITKERVRQLQEKAVAELAKRFEKE